VTIAKFDICLSLFQNQDTMQDFRNQRRASRRKGQADIDAQTLAEPRRLRLNPYTNALRRERIFVNLQLGWFYADIAGDAEINHFPVERRTVLSFIR
jgi:hypothetical protein